MLLFYVEHSLTPERFKSLGVCVKEQKGTNQLSEIDNAQALQSYMLI